MNLGVKGIIDHLVATKPLGGINPRDFQRIFPSLKVAF